MLKVLKMRKDEVMRKLRRPAGDEAPAGSRHPVDGSPQPGPPPAALRPRPAVGGLFYGWWIVAAASVIFVLGAGVSFSSFGVFVRPLEAEFGWSRAEISLAASLGLVVSGLAGLAIGPWTDRFGARVVISLGALAMGACFFLLAATFALWYFYLAFALMATARAGCIFIPLNALIMRWFVRRRSLAMAIAATGMGFSGVAMVPLMAVLVESTGWRWAFALAGIAVLGVVAPLGALVVRSKPADLGLQPDGDAAPPPAVGSRLAGGATGNEFRQRIFWQIVGVIGLAFFAQIGLVVHLVPSFEARGYSAAEAAGFFSAASAISIPGRFLSGFAIGRWLSPRSALGVLLAGKIAGLSALALTDWGLPVFIVLFGFAMGGLPTVEPLTVAAYFGAGRFGRVLGRMGLVETAGILLGPLLAGVLYDRFASYQPVLLLFLAAYVLALIGVGLLPAAPRAAAA